MGKASALREEAIAAFKAADALVSGEEGPKPEDQERFDTEFARGQDLMKQYQEQAAVEGKVVSVREALSDMAGAIKGQGPIPFQARTIEVDRKAGKSLGQLVVESKEYADLIASGSLHSEGQSLGRRTLGSAKAANTDIVNTGTGQPAAGLVTPEYLPNVVDLPGRPLTIRELFAQGTTTSDSISYAQMKSRSGVANAVAQATAANNGAKPQVSVEFERKTSPVETIAAWMAVTRQTLADVGQAQSIIDNQLRLFLQIAEEEQLLNGNGTSPNLSGIYDQSIQTLDLTAAASAGDVNLDGVRNAMRLVKTGVARATADSIVLNPTDSMEFDLLVDGMGQYRIGDPYAYNATGQPRPIWGLRRVESEAVAEGSALVGAFKVGATVLERQGVVILTADQHADFFIRNLIVLLAEERLGFPVFFPSAFVDVTLAAWGEAS